MRAPLPSTLLLTIRLPTFHALFSAFGYPSSLPPSPLASFCARSLPDVVRAAASDDLPLPLARAFFTISAFAIEQARVEVYAAADALDLTTHWPEAQSPADLIASLLALATSDPRIFNLLRAARILRDRSFRPYTSHVYLGRREVDPSAGDPIQHTEPLRAAIETWARARDLGAVLPIDARTEGELLSFEITHEDRLRTIVASVPQTPETFRPLLSHRVTYAARRRRLTITTDRPEVVTPLATIFGEVLFGSARHFLDLQAVDLWPLQERGEAALSVPALAPKLTMTAIGGTWHSGKGHAMTPRGRDFFKALARYKIRIDGGFLDLMTLRGTHPADDGGPPTCDVVLRSPHLLTVSEPEHAPLAHDFLDRAKITTPEPRPRDFYSRQPWKDPPAPWVEFCGQEGFDGLVAAGILEADPSNRSVTPPDHPHAGRTATAYPLSGSKYLACSPDPTIPPFVVDERDLVAYSLRFDKLAAAIAAALSLEGAAKKLDDDGVLFCGRRDIGPTFVLAFLLTRPIRAVTAQRLVDAAGHGHAIAIVPETRKQELPLRQIAMPKLAGPWQPLLGAIVRALRLELHVDATLYAPPDARVVLHRATQRVWIDGVLCAALTEAHLRLLEILIERGSAPVHTKDIAAHVAPGHETPDTTRRVIESFFDAAEKSFKLLKKRAPKDLRAMIARPKHAHYALGVKGALE